MRRITKTNEKTRHTFFGRAAGLLAVLMLPLAACVGPPHHEFMGCVDFESLPPATDYVFLDTFTDSGVPITVEAFQWSNGTWTTGNHARVDTRQMAGGTGKDINLNNVNLRFHLGKVGANALTVAVGEYGGNINMQVNGEFRNFENFPEIDSTMIGGTQVSVAGGAQNQTGTVSLTGLVKSFSIGGQELWIDDVCS